MKVARKLASFHARFVAALDRLLLPSPRRDVERKDRTEKYFARFGTQDDLDLKRRKRKSYG
jgi:hypothetical protein